MAQHRTNREAKHHRSRLAGGLLLGALASATFATASLGSAPDANASCASAAGVHVGKGCKTTNLGDVAIGLGRHATATASGGFSTAISFGNGTTSTTQGGKGNLALAVGNDKTLALSEGNRVTTIVVGPDSSSRTGGNGAFNYLGQQGKNNITVFPGFAFVRLNGKVVYPKQ